MFADSAAGADQGAMSWIGDRRWVPILFLLLLQWTRSIPGPRLGQGMCLCPGPAAAAAAVAH